MTKNELNELKVESELPAELVESIENAIEPKYIRKEKVSNRKTALTIISALAAAGSTLLPYPFGRFVGGALILLTIPVIISIIRLTIDPITIKKYRKSILYGIFSFISLIVALPMGLVTLVKYERWGHDHMPYLLMFMMSGATSIFLGMLSYQIHKGLRLPASINDKKDNTANSNKPFPAEQKAAR